MASKSSASGWGCAPQVDVMTRAGPLRDGLVGSTLGSAEVDVVTAHLHVMCLVEGG